MPIERVYRMITSHIRFPPRFGIARLRLWVRDAVLENCFLDAFRDIFFGYRAMLPPLEKDIKKTRNYTGILRQPKRGRQVGSCRDRRHNHGLFTGKFRHPLKGFFQGLAPPFGIPI